MNKRKTFTVTLDDTLYETARLKADKLGLPLATLVRIFLKSFTTQSGVGFYVGDQNLAVLFNDWMRKRQFEKMQGTRTAAFTPRLRDLFELSEPNRPKNLHFGTGSR